MDCSQLYRSWLQDNILCQQNFLAYLKIHLFEYGTPLILLQTKEGRKYYRQGCPLQRLQFSGFLVSNLKMKMQQFRKRSFHKVVMGLFNLVQTSCHACMKDWAWRSREESFGVKTKALSRHLRKGIISRSICVEYRATVKAASGTAVREHSSPSSGDTAWDGHETHCSEQLGSASRFPGITDCKRHSCLLKCSSLIFSTGSELVLFLWRKTEYLGCSKRKSASNLSSYTTKAVPL